MSILKLNFLNSIETSKIASVTTLFYLLKGKLQFSIQNKSYPMGKQDVVVVNKHEQFKVSGDHVILVQIEINEKEYLKLTSSQMNHINCNSMMNKNDNFDKLKKALDILINKSFEENYEKIFFEKSAYDLLTLLFTDYTEYTIRLSGEENRKDQIENYIKTNYQNNISLEEVSDYFGLTPQYFSKYFKEIFHISFLKYLNEIRFERACEDLVNTDHTIIKIALDNGFPNVSSFTKAFINKYNQKPSDYRLKINRKKENEKYILKEDVQAFLEHKDIVLNENIHEIKIAHIDIQPLTSFWKRVCNLGSLSKLLNSDLNNQFEILKKELGFEYARLILDRTVFDKEKQNFFEEEKVFDYLLELHFKQIIVIDFRMYQSVDTFIDYLKRLLCHCINRYGISNVKKWEYELYYDTVFTKEKAQSFHQFKSDLNQMLKSIKIEKEVYGPGVLIDANGDNLRQFLKYNKDIKEVSISIAPYSLKSEKTDVFLNRISDSNYISHQYHIAKMICEENDITKLHVSSWKNMLVENHYINDSSYRAANIIKNILQGYDELPALPIDYPLDLMFDYHMGSDILSGLPGLLTRNGVKKPSFYAYKFLNKLDRFFVYKDDYCLITNDTNNYFEIVCHNCKDLNYKFYDHEGNGFDQKMMSQYFEDSEELTFSFHIADIEDGTYFIKSRYVNDDNGSALSEWIKMNFEDSSFFGPDEMQFLKAVSQPSINGKTVQTEQGALNFTFTLQPNEIRHIHIIHLN